MCVCYLLLPFFVKATVHGDCLVLVVVVMCGDEDIIRKFMLAAFDNGMTSGDYVFISLTLLPSGRVTAPWVRHDARDNDAMKAYQPLLEVQSFQIQLFKLSYLIK